MMNDAQELKQAMQQVGIRIINTPTRWNILKHGKLCFSLLNGSTSLSEVAEIIQELMTTGELSYE